MKKYPAISAAIDEIISDMKDDCGTGWQRKAIAEELFNSFMCQGCGHYELGGFESKTGCPVTYKFQAAYEEYQQLDAYDYEDF